MQQVFTPNDAGKIYVHGLEADTYKLIENCNR